MTKPLRELTQQDTKWCWDYTQNTALNQLKEAVTCTPILHNYNLSDEVTLQCDASQSGLGTTILQKGQPVAYASRALTSAETHCTQIEEELSAILFACERFDTYIYGRDVVRDETDHKPLEAIMRSIIKELKAVFAWFGIPDVVVTDNGPQLSSAEFSGFSRIWGFDHVTSSPKYPQSNGKAKNGVKTVK